MVTSIEEKFLENNNLLALEFREGWLFSRILRGTRIDYDRHGEVGRILTTATLDAKRFETPAPAKDILYIEAVTPPSIIQAAIGISPSMIRAYIHHPEEGTVIGKPPNLDPASYQSGDTYGYISGRQSPYDDPSDFRELWITPQVHITAEWYNPDTYDHEPLINIKAKLYSLDIFNPNGDDYEKHMIRVMAQRKVPCAFESVGNPQNLLGYKEKYKTDWGVEPISIREAARLVV